MRFYEILEEGYKEVKQKFVTAGVDKDDVEQVIDQFRQLVTKNQIKDVQEKNIDYWGKQGYDELKSFVSKFNLEKTRTQVKRKRVVGKSIIVKETDEWLIVVPLDKEASCFHGKDSDWCTTKPYQQYFEKYYYEAGVILIYCLRKSDGGMWALAVHEKMDKIEIFDKRDRDIDKNQFTAQTGLDADEITETVLTKYSKTIEASRDKYREVMELLEKYDWNNRKLFTKRIPELEAALEFTKNSNYITIYVMRMYQHAPKLVNEIPEGILRIGAVDFPHVLKYVHNKSYDFYRAVTKGNNQAWEYIRADEMTPELEKLKYQPIIDRISKPFTIEHQDWEHNPLERLPKHLRSPDVYVLFAKNIEFPTQFLQFIPEENRSEEVCRIAIKKDYRNRKSVPEKLLLKVENPDVLKYIRSQGKNPDNMTQEQIRRILVDEYMGLVSIPDKDRKEVEDSLMGDSISLSTVFEVLMSQKRSSK